MSEALRAHERLMESMPRERIRTHYRHAPQETGSRGGREKLPVEVKGVIYPSLNDAARALGVARQTVRNMVRRGEAFLR
jgi:hypothetical protein